MSRLLLVLLFFTSAWADEVQVRSASGNSYLEVRLNDILTIEMVIDTGAGQVAVPEAIFQLLLSRGTISKAEMLPDTNALPVPKGKEPGYPTAFMLK